MRERKGTRGTRLGMVGEQLEELARHLGAKGCEQDSLDLLPNRLRVLAADAVRVEEEMGQILGLE